MSNASSSSSAAPSKLIVRTSQRAKKLNSRLVDFLLTMSRKLTQFKSVTCADSDSTRMSSIPSKTHATHSPIPSNSLKRQPQGRVRSRSPVKKSIKWSPLPRPQELQASDFMGSTGRPGQLPQQLKGDHVCGTGQILQKKASRSPSAGGEDLSPEEEEDDLSSEEEEDDLSSEEDEEDLSSEDEEEDMSSEEEEEEEELISEEKEGLGQEEMDRRLALQLQQQFQLADRLNLDVVRFKGTADQYTFRRCGSRISSKQ